MRGCRCEYAGPPHRSTPPPKQSPILAACWSARPGRRVSADLEVWAGLQPVQTIPPSGGQASGLTGYDLPRASETVAHHGRAEFFLPWGQSRMPVGMVRPRRLATGAEVDAGQLDHSGTASQSTALTAALYLARAPWRPPVVLPVPGDGVVPLPPEVRNAGPLRVLLRVDDPWVVSGLARLARPSLLCLRRAGHTGRR